MTDFLSRLQDVAPREAWAHEAQDFTPWLAANLHILSEEIGIPLDVVGTEERVGSFIADILAVNPQDDSTVLIENQLERSDHTHLGQIMTYLAGLNAQTIIWVAPSFSDEHLSALRWLNEHTSSPFAFFAVQFRVVRISDSPLAPLFEVIERPNWWDRMVSEKSRTTKGGLTELGRHRLNFWSFFCKRHPEQGEPAATSSRWVPLKNTDAVCVQYLAKSQVGLFVRPDRGGSLSDLAKELEPYRSKLEQELEAEYETANYFLVKRKDFNSHDERNWDAMSDWLAAETERYQKLFATTLG